MQQKQRSKKIKKVKILVTGDDNYNNLSKFNNVMDELYDVIPQTKVLYTYGGKYGAQLLARLYAQQHLTDFRQFTTSMFKTNKLSSSQLYHMMMNLSIKKTDLVIIFSNVMTKKIQTIINKCIDNNIDYLVVKE